MNLDAFLDLLRALVLLVVFIGTLRLILSRQNPLRLVFFELAIASIMLSDFYWLVYDLLRPGVRMPFAANEIAEWAMFLLLGACLATLHPIHFSLAKKELLGTTIFTIGNVALWIAWSGEWLQDILTGIVLAYFLYALIISIKEEAAYGTRNWCALAISCAVLLSAQAAIFFVPETLQKPLDYACYALLFLASAMFIAKSIYALIRERNASKIVCYAFAAFAWNVITLYMSSGYFYTAAMILSAICFVLMFLAIRKEAIAS